MLFPFATCPSRPHSRRRLLVPAGFGHSVTWLLLARRAWCNLLHLPAGSLICTHDPYWGTGYRGLLGVRWVLSDRDCLRAAVLRCAHRPVPSVS